MAFSIDCDLTLERISSNDASSSLRVTTTEENVVHVDATGQLPSVPMAMIWDSFRLMRRFVELSGQSVCVTHEAKRLVYTGQLPNGDIKTMVYWSAVFGSLTRKFLT